MRLGYISTMDHPAGHTAPRARSGLRTYLPLVLALTVIAGWVALRATLLGFELARAMRDAMGGFFLVFGGMKVVNWRSFAENYRMYDPIAARSRLYAYLYPAIELYLGIGYQFGPAAAVFDARALHVVTIAVLGIATVGVVRHLRTMKPGIRCACLGALFNVPLSWATVAENAAMILMAAAMLGGVVR